MITLESYIGETKNNITNTLCSSPLIRCVVFITADLKTSLNFILCVEINKQPTANERGHRFPWFIFYKKRRQTTSLLP